jgi:hypothetical protein
MPPKKKEEVKTKPILGRFRTNLKVGAPDVLGSLALQKTKGGG